VAVAAVPCMVKSTLLVKTRAWERKNRPRGRAFCRAACVPHGLPTLPAEGGRFIQKRGRICECSFFFYFVYLFYFFFYLFAFFLWKTAAAERRSGGTAERRGGGSAERRNGLLLLCAPLPVLLLNSGPEDPFYY
jgi:hypothetical protein